MTNRTLTLDRLVVRGVRNLDDVVLEPAPHQNLIVGDNGQGKTSLLEAIYLVLTSRSFRTTRLRIVAAMGQPAGSETFTVRADLSEQREGFPPMTRNQTATLARGAIHVRIDGNRPAKLAEFATRSPVVVFHQGELAMSTGPASLRRRLLDRIGLYLAPAAAGAGAAYARAIKARQELLRRGSAHPSELAAYEAIAAKTGAELTRLRQGAASELSTESREAFGDFGAPGLELMIGYRPGGDADEECAQRELCDRRSRDARTPVATFGPHRDDLSIDLDGKPARSVASQGQHRSITLALKAGESATIARLARIEPIQLLDDVSSELDPGRTRALFSYLEKRRSQLFVTTPRPELLELSGEGKNTKTFQVLRGSVRGL